jgi:hypothetical protein
VEPFQGVYLRREMWRSVLLGAVLAGVLASGCGGGQGSGPVDCIGGSVSNGGCVLTGPVTVVSPSATTPVSVTGGTQVMRARALRILEGMGQVAIASVRFGRAPVTYPSSRLCMVLIGCT